MKTPPHKDMHQMLVANVHQLGNKQNACNGMLLNNKVRWIIDTFYNIDKPQKHYARDFPGSPVF